MLGSSNSPSESGAMPGTPMAGRLSGGRSSGGFSCARALAGVIKRSAAATVSNHLE